MTTTTKPPSLTPHQKSVLLSLGRSLTSSTDTVREDCIGSRGALAHLVRKGYADMEVTYGALGGQIRWYGLTDLGRHVFNRYAQVPTAIAEYFDEPEANPTVEQVFIPERGWVHTGWDHRVITRAMVAEMYRANVTTVAVRYGRSVADFQVKELTR